MIYFIKTPQTAFVKIGFTKFRDSERIESHNTSSPFKYELLLFIEGTLSDEKELHKKFKNSLIQGKYEWFNITKEITDYIEQNKDKSIVPTKVKEKRKGNKTEPIGVRFDIEKLSKIKKEQNLDSPQKVLNWLMDNYESAVTWNNRMAQAAEAIKNQPPTVTTTSSSKDIKKEEKSKDGSEPKPGTMAYYLKHGKTE